MYERDFARRLSVHWCDLDKQEIVEAVGPSNIAGSGLLDEAETKAAHAADTAKLRAEVVSLETSREGWKQTALVLQELRDEAAKREAGSRARIDQSEAECNALRAKLAEAERDANALACDAGRADARATMRATWDAAIDIIETMDYGARTSLRPEECLTDCADALRSARDTALPPSPASEGGNECRDCANVDTEMHLEPCRTCKKDGWSKFVRRLPLAPAKPADKHCGDCVYRNTTAAPGLCANVFSALYQEARGTDDAKACDLHSTKWLCGRCLGGGFAKHTHNCSLRDKPEPQPARTCGDAKPDTCGECPSLSFRNTCESHTSTHSGHVRGTLDPACPAFVRSPAAEQEVKS